MAISVRPACLAADRQQIVDTLQRNAPQLPHDVLFPWLYLANPEGAALVWIATDTSDDRTIAVAAAFPRRMYWSGREALGYVLGDFCVDADHRSLGVALKLQRACLEDLQRQAARFVFDFPSRSMLAVYKRLGIDSGEWMIRYARPLRLDGRIPGGRFLPAVASSLAAVANAGLRLRDAWLSDTQMTGHGEMVIAQEEGPWGEEFTELSRNRRRDDRVCVARSAQYLNWRYRKHPQQSYEMLTARHSSELKGYVIFHCTGVNVAVDELEGEDERVGKILLTHATAAAAHRRSVQTISIPWLASHPWASLFGECGFRRRESHPIVLLAFDSSNGSQPSGRTLQWHLSQGDWES